MKSRKGVALIALIIRQLKNYLIDAKPTWGRSKHSLKSKHCQKPNFQMLLQRIQGNNTCAVVLRVT